MPVSPAKAANIAGVSRSVISRALKDGALVGTKRNNGHWAIERPDLERWMDRAISRDPAPLEVRAAPAVAPAQEADPLVEVLQRALDEAREELSGVREELVQVQGDLAATRARLDAQGELVKEVREDRDAWKAQASSLANRQPGRIARFFGFG